MLERLPLAANSDNFVFDNQMLAQIHFFGFRIGEVSCPTRYRDDSSSIRFAASCRYGLGVLASLLYRRPDSASRVRLFDANGRLEPALAPSDQQAAGAST